MKAREIREKSDSELRDLLREFQERAEALRFETLRQHVKNVKERVSVKRDIARVLTVLNSRASL